MRKRRAWSTLDDDADAQESAALAASLAAAKDTAAQSDKLISSAKQDLSGHQRWLEAQSAAVQRDRERHERWLQRQQESRLASAKKERIRRHRQLVRRRALQAIGHAAADLYAFIRSWIAFGVGKAAARAGAVARSIANVAAGSWRAVAGVAGSVSRRLGRRLSASFRSVSQAVVAGGRRLRGGARQMGQKIGLAAQNAGAGVAAGAAWGGARAKESMRAGSEALAARSQAAASEAGKLSRQAGHALESGGRALGDGLAATGDSAASFASTTRAGVASRASSAAARAAAMCAKGGRSLSRVAAGTVSRARAIPSKLFIHVARLGREVQHFARIRAAAPGKSAAPTAQEETLSAATVPSVESALQSDRDGENESGHTASVHVFETYGPHPDGTTLFGQPGNDPWTRDRGREEPIQEAEAAAATEAKENSLTAGLGMTAGSGADVAAGLQSVLSSWIRTAKVRAGGLGRWIRRRAEASTVWLQRQSARSYASARAGLGSVARTQEAAVAHSARWVLQKGIDLSQMMIVAGAVLLVLGGLLVGGGFLMRTTSDRVIAAEPTEETFSKIPWAFDQPEIPLPERAVFTLSGTPQSFMINGLSIAGFNNSGETLTRLEASFHSDVKRPDLRLDVVAASPDEGLSAARAGPAVPPGSAFRLNFHFPPEAGGSADGVTVEDFFESYGGLLLTLRYDVDGAERSIIRYLDPEMLRAQLDEVAAQASGS